LQQFLIGASRNRCRLRVCVDEPESKRRHFFEFPSPLFRALLLILPLSVFVQHFDGITEFQAAGARNSSVHQSPSQETTPGLVDQARGIADSFRISSTTSTSPETA
jgi:hypothetical protein